MLYSLKSEFTGAILDLVIRCRFQSLASRYNEKNHPLELDVSSSVAVNSGLVVKEVIVQYIPVDRII